MLDQQHRDVVAAARATVARISCRSLLGHAGGRLVEQQHARLAGEGERDLQQPLLAVGQDRACAGPSRRRAGSARAISAASSIDRASAPSEPPPAAAAAERARRPRAPMVSSGVRSREQLVDLEGARDAARCTRSCGARRVMSAPSSRMRPRGRAQHAGQQVDERGLAGAVRADQRVARALSRRSSETLLVATMPPKRLSRPTVSSAMPSRRALMR